MRFSKTLALSAGQKRMSEFYFWKSASNSLHKFILLKYDTGHLQPREITLKHHLYVTPRTQIIN
jgi:hypothetical protein